MAGVRGCRLLSPCSTHCFSGLSLLSNRHVTAGLDLRTRGGIGVGASVRCWLGTSVSMFRASALLCHLLRAYACYAWPPSSRTLSKQLQMVSPGLSLHRRGFCRLTISFWLHVCGWCSKGNGLSFCRQPHLSLRFSSLEACSFSPLLLGPGEL
jgi:hypothetical protein